MRSIIYDEWDSRTGERAQWVKVLTVKLGNLYLVLRTYMVERESWLAQIALWPLQAHQSIYIVAHIHTPLNMNKQEKM